LPCLCAASTLCGMEEDTELMCDLMHME